MHDKDDDGPLLHFQLGFMSEDNGRKRKSNLKVDPEDVLAIGAFIIALLFTCAIIFGSAPLNTYTVAIIGFSAIAAITKTRAKQPSRTPWVEWIVIVLLLLGFGTYVWLTSTLFSWNVSREPISG